MVAQGGAQALWAACPSWRPAPRGGGRHPASWRHRRTKMKGACSARFAASHQHTDSTHTLSGSSAPQVRLGSARHSVPSGGLTAAAGPALALCSCSQAIVARGGGTGPRKQPPNMASRGAETSLPPRLHTRRTHQQTAPSMKGALLATALAAALLAAAVAPAAAQVEGNPQAGKGGPQGCRPPKDLLSREAVPGCCLNQVPAVKPGAATAFISGVLAHFSCEARFFGGQLGGRLQPGDSAACRGVRTQRLGAAAPTS